MNDSFHRDGMYNGPLVKIFKHFDYLVILKFFERKVPFKTITGKLFHKTPNL